MKPSTTWDIWVCLYIPDHIDTMKLDNNIIEEAFSLTVRAIDASSAPPQRLQNNFSPYYWAEKVFRNYQANDYVKWYHNLLFTFRCLSYSTSIHCGTTTTIWSQDTVLYEHWTLYNVHVCTHQTRIETRQTDIEYRSDILWCVYLHDDDT